MAMYSFVPLAERLLSAMRLAAPLLLFHVQLLRIRPHLGHILTTALLTIEAIDPG